MIFWYGLSSVIFGVVLYFPTRKFIFGMMVNKQLRKLNRELTDEEREPIRRKAYITAAFLAMTFAFLYNRYLMKSFLGLG